MRSLHFHFILLRFDLQDFPCLTCLELYYRILHSEGFSKEEFAARAPVIYANTVTAMWALIEAVASLSIRIDPHDAHFEVMISLFRWKFSQKKNQFQLILSI